MELTDFFKEAGAGAVTGSGLAAVFFKLWFKDKLDMLKAHEEELRKVVTKDDMASTIQRFEDSLERTGEQLSNAIKMVADTAALTHKRIDDFMLSQATKDRRG